MLKFYTDGSSLNNQDQENRVGGYCTLQINPESDLPMFAYVGTAKGATNSDMEVRAALEAVEHTPENCEVSIYSDSAYVVNSINLWLKNWIKNNTPKAQWEYWLKFNQICTEMNISPTAIKVKGHSNDLYNNMCDFFATQMASGEDSQTITGRFTAMFNMPCEFVSGGFKIN